MKIYVNEENFNDMPKWKIHKGIMPKSQLAIDVVAGRKTTYLLYNCILRCDVI